MILPPSALPIDRYHAAAFNMDDRWLSKTSIRDFQEHGPAWWDLAYNQQEVERPTPDGVEQGLALDCFLTEGEAVFRARYPEIPEDAPKRPTKAQWAAAKPSPQSILAVGWWRQWSKAHPGTLELGAADRLILVDAAAAVRALPCWSDMEASMAQATVRRKAEGALFGIQSRPDFLFLPAGGPCRYRDLKKCRSLRFFDDDADRLGYCCQAAVAGYALAGDGISMESASLVAVEWERGARAEEVTIPDEVLDLAWKELQATAGEIARRMEANDWRQVQEKPRALRVGYKLRQRMEAA